MRHVSGPQSVCLLGVMLIAMSCGRTGGPQRVVAQETPGAADPEGGGDGGAAARQDLREKDSARAAEPPAASSAAQVLRLRVPSVLPCKEFAALSLGHEANDVIEWWQPGASGEPPSAPSLRLDTDGAVQDRLVLPAGFVPRGPVVLRFLRRPALANKAQEMKLECRDAQARVLAWVCREGACEPVIREEFPRRLPFAAIAPDRFGARWSCGSDCSSPRALDRLLLQEFGWMQERSTDGALRPSAHPQLVRLGREVAADLAGFITQSCRGDRCTEALRTAGRELEQLGAPRRVEVLVARILQANDPGRKLVLGDLWEDSGTDRSQAQPVLFSQLVSVGSGAGEADLRLSLSCEFRPNLYARRAEDTLCKVQLERRPPDSTLRPGWLAVLEATLSGQVPLLRSVRPASGGLLSLVGAQADIDAPMMLQIDGEALAGPALPPAERMLVPAPVPPPPLGRAEFTTRWPEARLCEVFAKVSLQLSPGLLGVEWRGPGTQPPLRLVPAAMLADTTQPFRSSPELYTLELAPTMGDSRALGALTTATLLRAEGATIGPRQARLGLKLKCLRPAGADVEFSCVNGQCQTTAQRDLALPDPIDGRYLGPRGWDCIFGGRCPHQRDLASLSAAKPDVVKGERAALTLRLARDLLSELAAVIEEGCPELCSQGPLDAAQTVRRLLATELQIESVQVRARRHEDYADRVVGFVAQIRPVLPAGSEPAARTLPQDLRWELDCRRETELNGALGPSFLSRCTGTLRAGKVSILRYLPSFEQRDARNGSQDLESYDQSIEFGAQPDPQGVSPPQGTLTVHTGFSYSSAGLHADRWDKGAVSGNIQISGTALRSH